MPLEDWQTAYLDGLIKIVGPASSARALHGFRKERSNNHEGQQDREPEIEHVLHAGDILAFDLGDEPHVPSPGFEAVFGEPPAPPSSARSLSLRTNGSSERPIPISGATKHRKF